MRRIRPIRITAEVLASAGLMIFAGSASAQINPATAKGIAQSGAKAAQTATPAAQGTPTQAKPAAPAPAPKTGQKDSTSGKAPVKRAATKAAAAKPTATKPAENTATKAPAKTPAKTPATGTSTKAVAVKPAEKPAARAGKPPVEKPHEVAERPVNRRDPFSYLVGKTSGGGGSTVVLPPGKAGLQVESLLIQGIVSSPEGMIAVVANPQQRVYFLHEGDQLFDGSVVKIGMEAITFHEVGRDAFGKPTEREVTKRLHNSSGELP